MNGRSLVPVLASSQGGQIDPTRNTVFTGRERHVENARAGFLPYPQRAIRTQDFLYIINFHPERYPLGDPYGLDGASPPSEKKITEETRATLPDEDAGPSKAWLVGVRNDPQWRDHYEWVYGRRPREELYDLRKDRHETKNVATDPAYAEKRAELEKRLLGELERTGDPRMKDDGKFYETPPMAGPLEQPKRGPNQRPPQ
jgi:arylsulfatase A-like enzyme